MSQFSDQGLNPALLHWERRILVPGPVSFMRLHLPKENQTPQNQYSTLKLIKVSWTKDIILPEMKLLLIERMRF